jgi:CubicO group peptidase (beta-lactamase class C family)
MKYSILLSFVFLVSLSCQSQHDIDHQVKELFRAELEKETVNNAFLHVYSMSKDINIQLADGEFVSGDRVGTKNPFYVASIGKTVTATAIGLLKDNNQLAFEDPISKYLSEDILKDLHVFEGVDYTKDITIAHLLQHTSGLSDYFEDKTVNGTPNMMEQLFMNPKQEWTSLELIQFYKNHMKSLFPPGKSYHYTDTEYVLLGLIIEQVSGLELHKFFKQHILKPLGMNSTYMNLRSEPIQYTSEMAEIYASNFEISSFKSLSADWAGGGIVSTTQDLITFQEALFNGALLKTETLASMKQWIPETQGMYYGFGLRKIVFSELHSSLPEIEVIGHSGSTGSFLYFCPNLDVYISGTLNQTDEVNNSVVFVSNVLNIVKKIN